MNKKKFNAKKINSVLKKKDRPLSLHQEIKRFEKSYLEEKYRLDSNYKSARKIEAKVAWADMINERNKKSGIKSIIEKKGIYKSNRLYFRKTLKDEKKYRVYLKNKDEENEYTLSQRIKYSDKRAVLKGFNKKNCIIVSCCLIAYAVFYPIVRAKILEWTADRRPPARYEREDLYPNEEVQRTEDGDIIEYPVINEELVEAYSILTNRLKNGFKSYGVDIKGIGDIQGIYEHNMGNDGLLNQSKMIEILVKSEGKLYSIQYVKDGEINLNTSENDTRTISSFIENLFDSYIYGASEITPEKQEILDTMNDNTIYIGDYFAYGDSTTGRALYTIPTYSDTGYKTYSVPENELLSEDDVYLEFLGYLKKENTLFTEKSEEGFQQKYLCVLNACDRAVNSYLSNLSTSENSEDFIKE